MNDDSNQAFTGIKHLLQNKSEPTSRRVFSYGTYVNVVIPTRYIEDLRRQKQQKKLYSTSQALWSILEEFLEKYGDPYSEMTDISMLIPVQKIGWLKQFILSRKICRKGERKRMRGVSELMRLALFLRSIKPQ